jgi:NitT/TauT family transport system substrate-binding protein
MIMFISRKSVLSAGFGMLLVAALALPASNASAEDVLKMRMDFFPHELFGPFLYAVQEGWFKEQGIDLKIDDGNGSTTTVQLVGNGSYDLGFANLSTMAIGHSKGINVVAIGEVLHRLDVGLIVDKKLDIKSPKELAEKKVQVVALTGGFMGSFMELYFKRAGTNLSQINVLNVSDEGGAYLAGQGGAVFTTIPYLAPVLKQRPSDIFWATDLGINMPAFGIIANGDVIKNRPEVLKKFMAVANRAWAKAWAGSGTEMIDALIKARPNAKLDATVEMDRFEAYKPLGAGPAGKPVLYLSPALWDEFFKVMKETGSLPADAKATDYYTNDFQPMG